MNAFGIARALDLKYGTVAKDCSVLVQEGRLRQEIRPDSYASSVHYHAC